MKQETIDRIIEMIQKEDPETDMLLVMNNEKAGVSSVIYGDVASIAKAMFMTTFDSANPKHANDIYNIVRNIAVNLVANSCPMGKDLEAAIRNNSHSNEK